MYFWSAFDSVLVTPSGNNPSDRISINLSSYLLHSQSLKKILHLSVDSQRQSHSHKSLSGATIVTRMDRVRAPLSSATKLSLRSGPNRVLSFLLTIKFGIKLALVNMLNIFIATFVSSFHSISLLLLRRCFLLNF